MREMARKSSFMGKNEFRGKKSSSGILGKIEFLSKNISLNVYASLNIVMGSNNACPVHSWEGLPIPARW